MRSKKIEKKVYDYLLTQIKTGILGPNTKIVEQDVAQELKVSRSPVRSALLLLAEAGYLRLVPYKGAVVLTRQLDPRAYVEQLKVFELLFIQYLFQLEAKKETVPIEQLAQQLQDIAYALENHSRVEAIKLEVDLLSVLLSEQSNSYYKTLVLGMIKGILETDFSEMTLPEEDGVLLFFEHFKEIIDYLKINQHPQVRREVRIFVNNLTLAVIDKQDLGQLNKYES